MATETHFASRKKKVFSFCYLALLYSVKSFDITKCFNKRWTAC